MYQENGDEGRVPKGNRGTGEDIVWVKSVFEILYFPVFMTQCKARMEEQWVWIKRPNDSVTGKFRSIWTQQHQSRDCG